jgi:hypothetical protein
VGWREEYAAGALWAAFAGVPLALQGSLARALAAYGGADARARVALAQRYLDGAPADEEQAAEAAGRALEATLAPAALRAGVSADDMERLWDHVEGRKRRHPLVVQEWTAPDAESSVALHAGEHLYVDAALMGLVLRAAAVVGARRRFLAAYQRAWKTGKG